MQSSSSVKNRTLKTTTNFKKQSFNHFILTLVYNMTTIKNNLIKTKIQLKK